jgi:hypothetical protein
MSVVVIDVDREANVINRGMGHIRAIKFMKFAGIYDLLSSFWKKDNKESNY